MSLHHKPVQKTPLPGAVLMSLMPMHYIKSSNLACAISHVSAAQGLTYTGHGLLLFLDLWQCYMSRSSHLLLLLWLPCLMVTADQPDINGSITVTLQYNPAHNTLWEQNQACTGTKRVKNSNAFGMFKQASRCLTNPTGMLTSGSGQISSIVCAKK